MKPEFSIVPGAVIHDLIWGDVSACTRIVKDAYELHYRGQSVLPRSYFLRFPAHPSRRIIALPGQIDGAFGVAGIKWIASYPENVARGIPRASAVVILNDLESGYPIACLEGSIVSAARTASSAALAAEALLGRRSASSLGIVGTGLIARYVYQFLHRLGWEIPEVHLYDRDPAESRRFASEVIEPARHSRVVEAKDLERAAKASELLVFATIAGEPHVHDAALFAHHPAILHLSLRDISPDRMLEAFNVVDDVDHVMTAGTSLHLAEQKTGNRDFVHGTLGDLWGSKIVHDRERTAIFSPFGLGVLDLAVSKWVFDRARAAGDAVTVPQFFTEAVR